MPRPRLTRHLAACCAPQLLVAADFSLLGVNGPAVRRDLGLSDVELAWCFSAYSLAFGAVLLPCGLLADRLNRAWLLRVGLAVFALGALLSALASGTGLLIPARALQGAGAAATVPAALSLLAEWFAHGAARARALAVYGAVVSVGFVTGALAGGVAGATAGWRAGFALEVAVAIGSMGLVDASWSAARSRGRIASRRSAALRSVVPRANVCAGGLGAAALTATGTAGVVLLSLALQEDRGLTVLETSWLLAAFGLPAPAAGLLARRLAVAGASAVLGAGLAAQAAALGVLAALGTQAAFAWLALALAAFGTGHVVASAGVPLLALDGVAVSRQGTVSGLVSTAQFAGASAGPLVAAAFASRSSLGLAVAAGAAGAGAIAVWLGARLRDRHDERSADPDAGRQAEAGAADTPA